MERWLCRRLGEDTKDARVRSAWGKAAGLMGLVCNALLFAAKLAAGLASGSVAITADAVNNLSDAGSSLVTLLGFKLAAQKPDREHPFGHGRMEYISGLVVAMLIVLMGVELLQSSFEKVLHPTETTVTPLVMGILVVSILVKLYMWSYNRRIGRKIDSPAMEATAADSLGDAAATLVVLLSTALCGCTGWQVDGWCGLLVALFILRAGYDAAKNTIGPLLGQPPSPELVQKIQRLVMAHPEVKGIHDLIIHDYGPGRMMISLHAEVPANRNIIDVHDTIDNIERRINATLGCSCVIHMDPVVINDEGVNNARETVTKIVSGIDTALTIHDFRMVRGSTHTNIIFDIVIPFGFKYKESKLFEIIQSKVWDKIGKEYFCVISFDKDYNGI